MKNQNLVVILIGLATAGTLFFSQIPFTNAGNSSTFSRNRAASESDLIMAPLQDPQCIPVLNSWQRHVISNANLKNNREPTNYALAVDVNGDQWEDVLSGSFWYENPKSSIGSAWVRHDVGTNFLDVIDFYDFDGDGDVDLLGVSGDNWPLVWAENNGSGSFAIYDNIEAGITVPLPDPVTGVAINHFSSGGPLEVALTWDDTEDPAKNPHGIQMFTVPADPTTGTWARRKLADFSNGEELSEADIDNDGDLDLYAGNNWLRNEYPSSQWTLVETFVPTAGEVDRTFISDVDLDGDLDTIDSYGADPEGKMAWYEQPDGQPFGTWIEHLIFQSDTYPGFASAAVGDMDGDGDIDAVAGEHQIFGDTSIARTYVFENVDGHGGSWQEYLIYTGDESHNGMDVSDFDRDGDMDVLSTGTRHTRVHIYENLSNHNCGTPVPSATPLITSTVTNTPDPAHTPTNTHTPTATNTPTSTADSSCFFSPDNVLNNPSFENGSADWNFFTNGTGSFVTVSQGYHCDLAGKLTFTTVNNNMQLYQYNFPLKGNTAYRLRFAGYASTGHDLRVYLQQHTDPFTNYGINGTNFNLGTSWQEFNHEFTTSGFSGNSSDTRLRFWFVGNAANGDIYWLDNIRLEEVNSAQPTQTPTATPTVTAECCAEISTYWRAGI